MGQHGSTANSELGEIHSNDAKSFRTSRARTTLNHANTLQVPSSRNKRASWNLSSHRPVNRTNSTITAPQLKLLLLGTQDSGKSSLFRAIRQQSGSDFTSDELANFRNIIFANVLETFHQAIVNCKQKGITIAEMKDKAASRIEKICTNEMTLHKNASLYYDKTLADMIVQLYEEEDFRSELLLTAKQSEGVFKLMTLEDLKRFSEPDYSPTHQDILNAKKPTGNVEISKVRIDSFAAKIFDLSGHKSQLDRWYLSADGVDVVYYVASLAEYNKKSLDSGANMLQESLDIFSSTLEKLDCNGHITFILILNKRDVIMDRFDNEGMSQEFPDYTGGNDPNKGIEFIQSLYQQRFDKAKGNSNKMLHVFVTSAVDPEDVRNTFEQTKLLCYFASTGATSNGSMKRSKSPHRRH